MLPLTMSKTLSLVLLSLLSLPALARAQKAEPEPEPEVSGDEVELGDEGVSDDYDPDASYGGLSGGEENPDAPDAVFGEKTEDKPKVKATKKDEGYPTRVIDRPLNLPGGTSEINVAIPVNVDPFAIAASLQGTYAITSEVQAGLRYGLGRFADEFAVGKAVSIEAQYLFTDFVAGQLSIPMYLDPFALGLVLGAPMKFTFFDSFSLVVGRDLISFRLSEFLPSIDNASQNDANIAKRAINETVPLWVGNLTGGAIYQMSDKLALDVNLGTTFDDTIDAARVLMNAGMLFASSHKLDFGARVGASDLSQFSQSLELRLVLNLRI